MLNIISNQIERGQVQQVDDKAQDQNQYLKNSSSSCSENSSLGKYHVSADELRVMQDELEALHKLPSNLDKSIQYSSKKELRGCVRMIGYSQAE